MRRTLLSRNASTTCRESFTERSSTPLRSARLSRLPVLLSILPVPARDLLRRDLLELAELPREEDRLGDRLHQRRRLHRGAHGGAEGEDAVLLEEDGRADAHRG